MVGALVLLSSYTLARARDMANYQLPEDSRNIAAEEGRADNDVRQNRLLEDLLAKSAGMLEAFQEKRVRDQARSMLNAELEQQTAIAIERAERRRKVITWAMGTLFVAAQIIQIAANVKRAE